ncbi:MAG: hypothetical protein ACRYE8_05590 [Janthinobacterium lividum]
MIYATMPCEERSFDAISGILYYFMRLPLRCVVSPRNDDLVVTLKGE